jgi:hypothetical protein
MRKFYLLLLSVSLCLAFTNCRSSKSLFKDQDPVPAEFGKEQTTVLVIRTEQNKVNKALENAFQKYYSGPFELVEQKDLTSKKYSDIKKYRYCFRTKIQFQAASGMGDSRMAATNNYSYDVLDRKTMKVNGLDFYGGAYKGLMEAYVKKLEETKASNSK